MSQLILSPFGSVNLKTRSQPARHVRNKNPKPSFFRKAAQAAPSWVKLAREESVRVIEQSAQLASDSQFKTCKMSVTQGASANLNKAEQDHLVKLGQWHHRRRRRRERLRR